MRFAIVLLLPLVGFGQDRLTFGGTVRERYEYFHNGGWGREPQDDNGYLLQRYMLHADWHLGPRLRLFGELKSGIESGRTGGPRPADEDKLDAHQGFVEIALSVAKSHQVTLRAGRQELSFGSSRLVSVREGPNVRQSFDGARLTVLAGGWQVDTIAVRPVETNRGVFDDSPDHQRSFWGVYAVRRHVDLYYLGLDRRQARFGVGLGREQRHSMGTRLWGEKGSWDYNTEFAGQWGRFGSGPIRAWTVASDTGYRLSGVPLRPRLGLKADVASGDRDPRDGTLGTFNALFPKGAYFSEADLLGPYNLVDLHPSIQLSVGRTVTITPDADFFWRQSTRDGIYSTPGVLLASGTASDARYIGCHASVQAEWRVDRRTTFVAQYLHFFPGPFLREATPGRPVDFVTTWVSFRF